MHLLVKGSPDSIFHFIFFHYAVIMIGYDFNNN